MPMVENGLVAEVKIASKMVWSVSGGMISECGNADGGDCVVCSVCSGVGVDVGDVTCTCEGGGDEVAKERTWESMTC